MQFRLYRTPICSQISPDTSPSSLTNLSVHSSIYLAFAATFHLHYLQGLAVCASECNDKLMAFVNSKIPLDY